MFEKLAV